MFEYSYVLARYISLSYSYYVQVSFYKYVKSLISLNFTIISFHIYLISNYTR